VAGTVNAVTGKLEAPPPDELRALCACFDYVLLEADGSAGKPLKAWAAYEPVVCDYTTMTIAVLPLCAPVATSPATVHRFPLFTLVEGIAQGETITTAHLARIIRGGLFYRSYGTKVLVMH
jgi:probable selenium-dependent hydroxylase accessory protein YqeC